MTPKHKKEVITDKISAKIHDTHECSITIHPPTLDGIKILFLIGIVVGLGVCVMHYLGILGMYVHAERTWNAGILILSIMN